MSNSQPKNGALGIFDVPTRSLADNDVAAIRDLYGVNAENEVCCGAIAGKLIAGSVKPLRDTRVWAEESNTGRVAAQGDVASDGSFRLGGLSAGTYSVFWQKEGDAAPSPVGVIGTFKLEKDETRTIAKKISLDRSDVSLSYVGVNNQLTNAAVTLNTGREYTVYLGGKNIDPKKIAIEFNSPYITVAPNSLTAQDFEEGISVINFVVTVHAETPVGIYSIFATNENGSMSSLIGALNVQ